MDNEIVQEVMNRLDAVGEAISRGAVQGFEILVRQQYIVGFGYTLYALALITIGVAIIVITRRLIRDAETKREELLDHLKVDIPKSVAAVIADEEQRAQRYKPGGITGLPMHRENYYGRERERKVEVGDFVKHQFEDIIALRYVQLVSLVFFAWALFPLYRAAAHFYNPAYYAIHEVIRTFGG